MNLKNNILKEDAPAGGGFPGGIGTGLTLSGGYINGAPTGSVDETNNTKPSSKVRPEPHPTRHETEHPADEPDWHKRKDPYDPISELLGRVVAEEIFKDFVKEYFDEIEETVEGSQGDVAWLDGFASVGKEHNDSWEDFDNPTQGYTDKLPGWEVHGHLSDSLPKSVKDRTLPKGNHFEENGEAKRVMHPSKSAEYAQEKKERWEMNPMSTNDKTYAPHDNYKPVSIHIQEAGNKALDVEIPYTDSQGQQKKIKARDALRLPKDHPAHIQAAKIAGPKDAPANEPKKKEEPGKAAQAAAKPAQPGQPVKKGQTAKGQSDKQKPNDVTGGKEKEQAPPPEQKLSGSELKSNAEKPKVDPKEKEAKQNLDKELSKLPKEEQEAVKNMNDPNSESRKSMSKNIGNFLQDKGNKLWGSVKKWGHEKKHMVQGCNDSVKSIINTGKLGHVKNKETGKYEYSEKAHHDQKHALKHMAKDVALLGASMIGAAAVGGAIGGGLAAAKAAGAHAVGHAAGHGIGQSIAHGAVHGVTGLFHHGAAGLATHIGKDLAKHSFFETMGLGGPHAAAATGVAGVISHLMEGDEGEDNSKFVDNVVSKSLQKMSTYQMSSQQMLDSIQRHNQRQPKKDLEDLLKENISESKENSIQHFIEFATKRLKLKETPKVTLLTGKEYSNAKTSLGGYSPMTKEIFVMVDDRLTADICRTIAHEMVHRKQDELGLVRNEEKDGADGSPIENQAHAVAGILMREYGRINKEIYNEDINVDVDKGDTVLMGKFKNKETKIKDIGTDDHGMPTINGKKAVTFRVPEKKNINEELLLEGGAAGHLAHPYEDSDLTFSDMKEMINRGLIGGLDKEGPVSEKLDGQNIAFTVKDGQIRFGRNKGHVKNKGENSLDVKGIAQQFAGRGGIEKAFKNSSEDLQAAVKKLSPEQVNKMFGNGSKFMSLEIILPETQNVIPYGKNVLVMHGTIEYNKDGEQISRSTEDAKTFAKEVQKAGADKQKTFNIEGPKEIEFDNSNTKEYTQKAKQYNSELDKTIKQFGLNDKSKLEDYKRAWWNKELDNQSIKFSKQEKEGLIKRFADDDKTFGSKNFDDNKKKEWFKNYETNQLAKSQKKMINPIEMVFLNSGAQVLKRVNNFLSNDTKSKNALKKDTLESIKGIKNSKDPDKIAKLQKELQRLNAIGMDNVVPSEGVVFQYKGHPYKFTGAFAPINQINGTFKFDKPKKKEVTTDTKPVEKSKNETAIFSGRFQPFHAGHYSIYKSLVNKFGKDNVYIASSNAMDDVKSPFNFREKKNIMTTMFGIPPNKVVQVKNPYAPVEILNKLPKDAKYVTAVSQKDAERLEKGGKYFKNYDKVPNNKKKSYEHEGYFIVAPEMQLKVNGENISGTQLRATFGSSLLSVPEKKKIFQQIYPKFDKDVFAKIVVTTKKAEAVKQAKTKQSEPDTKKQKPSEKDLIDKLPKKLLSKTIKNPDTGRTIKLKSALRYDKSSKVRKNADSMVKQALRK